MALVTATTKKGFIILSNVLITSVVMVGLVLSVVLVVAHGGQSSYAQYAGNEVRALTDGCMEDALNKARSNAGYSGGTITRPEGTCVISVSKAGSVWTITASSSVSTYSKALQAVINRGGSSVTLTSWKEY